MRVTNEQMVANSLRRLSTRLGRYERAQSQLATGKRILKPSQDPNAAGRSLALRAGERSREQEARNATDALSRLQTTDSALGSISERLQRVNELAVSAASNKNDAERQAMKTEIQSIREELRAIANTRHRGAALFGGFTDAAEVVAADGTYKGDAGQIERRIGDGETVRVNVTAAEVFGIGSGSSPNVFTVLDQFAAKLDANDTAGMSAVLGDLETARATLGRSQAVVGAASNRVESSQQRTAETLLNLRSERAEVEDVDIAEAVLELQTQEMTYQATLSAMGRALPQSLVNFLQ